MADGTSIEWTRGNDGTPGATWNPVRGCSRVSPGCGGANHQGGCYAEKIAARFSGPGQPFEGFAKRTKHGGAWTGKMALVAELLDQPLRWRSPRRIFVNSMSDLFHENLSDEVIDDVFAVMALSPRHTFQVLTKRASRMRDYVNAAGQPILGRLEAAARRVAPKAVGPAPWTWPLPNVWLGVSVEDQQRADERIPDLLATPAAVRFLSCEPLLGPVELNHPRSARLDWVIVGGESGPNSRPMHPDWARSLRDQCIRAESPVPFFFKQWGEYGTGFTHLGTGHRVFKRFETFDQWVDKASSWVNGGICLDRDGRQLKNGRDFARARDDGRFPVTIMHRLGKKRAGATLDGREWREMPA